MFVESGCGPKVLIKIEKFYSIQETWFLHGHFGINSSMTV